MTFFKGTFLAGIIYLGLGVAFVLEALDVWTVRVGDLRFVGPITLVVVGLVVLLGSLDRADRQA